MLKDLDGLSGWGRDERRRRRRHMWSNTARARRWCRVWGKAAVSSCGGCQRGAKGQRGQGLTRGERERTTVTATATASALLHHRGVGEDDSIVVTSELSCRRRRRREV